MREQEKNEYRQAIQQNQHEIYVISFEEMDKIVASLPPPKRDKVKGTWESIRGTAGVGTNYYYSSSTDAVKLARLVGDLGGVSGQAYIKYYGANGGKPHIVLKAGLG